MLYSIGYQKLTINQLIMKLKKRNITHLLDIRSRPYSRKAAFSRVPLNKALAKESIEYHWKGDVLGGDSRISENEITALASWQKDRVACLLCMEANPMECHRDYEVGKRIRKYGVDVKHISGEADDEE